MCSQSFQVTETLKRHRKNFNLGPSPTRLSVDQSLGPIDMGNTNPFFWQAHGHDPKKNPRIPGLSKNCFASDTVLFFG